MIKHIYFVLSLICLFILVSCNPQKTEWKGTIEEVDGVTVVKNPAEPLYGKDAFLLEEEISIGVAVGKEEYTFSQISGIDVDREGNIYLIDALSVHIRVFDKDGQYLRTIGRKGQGPGEIQKHFYVQITPQNEVLVYDFMAQRMIFYSLEGEFLRQKSTAQAGIFFLPLRLTSNGNITVIVGLSPPPIGGKVLKMYDSSLELIKVIADEEKGQRGIFDIGKPTWFCDVSPNDTIVWGDSQDYTLHILNHKGELTKKIIKEHRFIEITAEDREKSKQMYEDPLKRGFKISFRRFFPAFSDLLIDEKDRVYVKTYERVEDEDELFYFDVFDPEGKYLAKVPVRANLNRNSVWKNSRVYTIEEDEDGYPVVKRYKVTWNY